jgi:hypothetical protein
MKMDVPCKACKNDLMFNDREVIREHLVQSGFTDNYLMWTKHRETQQRIESIVDERQKRTWISQMTCIVIMMMNVRMI